MRRSSLLEHVLERREALLGAGGVERRQGLVPCLHPHLASDPVALAVLGLGAAGISPGPNGGTPGAGTTLIVGLSTT